MAPPRITGDRPTLTKIIATLGPASDSPAMVERLIELGVSIFRLNFSHGDMDAHAKRLETVRAAARKLGRPTAVMGDLQGPKIRVGRVPEGGIRLAPGVDAEIVVGLEASVVEDGVPRLACSFEPLVREVEAGHRVLINDGAIRMLAVEADSGAGVLRCRVTTGGLVTTGKGINLPDSDLSVPALTDRDWMCAEWAIEQGVDLLALSFVRKPEEIRSLREFLYSRCPADRELAESDGGAIPIIAKMERPQAIARMDEIVAAADGIMVARGDLGVEMELAQVPVVQKKLVAACARFGKPCIVATQMLETMVESASPTRAEASDVANAIFDGAGAVMLSAESAVGKHPDLAVEAMARIARRAEEWLAQMPQTPRPPERPRAAHDRTAAIAHGAWHIAQDIGATAVVVWSQTGETARYLSQNGFSIPIIAYSSNRRAARRMGLLRGVTPVRREPPERGRLADWNEQVEQDLLEHGWVTPGDRIVLVAGKPLGEHDRNNLVAIHTVGHPGGFLQADA